MLCFTDSDIAQLMLCPVLARSQHNPCGFPHLVYFTVHQFLVGPKWKQKRGTYRQMQAIWASTTELVLLW